MEKYSIDLLNQVKRHIKNGGVIAYPTESCYGFGCDPFNYKAINQILKIKRRNKAKGLIVIAGSIHQLNRLIKPLSQKDQELLKRFWPGFYSIILPSKPQVPSVLTGKHNKIAVRVTKHNLVKQICQFMNIALVSTSANRSGHKPVKTYSECVRLFGNQVMVLPGNTNFAKRPSTILDWETSQILR